MTAPLSPAELATVARFNAGPDAPESLRERVAQAMHRADWNAWACGWPCRAHAVKFRIYADAAIAVITGGAS